MTTLLFEDDFTSDALTGWAASPEGTLAVVGGVLEATVTNNVPIQERAELSLPAVEMEFGRTYIFSFRVKPPAATSATGELFFQLRARPDAGEAGSSPVLALEIDPDEDEWVIANRADREEGDHDTPQVSNWRRVGAVNRGVFTEFMFEVRIAFDDTGYFKVWLDGQLVREYTGITGHKDERGPAIKTGLYKFTWPGQAGTDPLADRTAFIDDFKVWIVPDDRTRYLRVGREAKAYAEGAAANAAGAAVGDYPQSASDTVAIASWVQGWNDNESGLYDMGGMGGTLTPGLPPPEADAWRDS